MASHAHALIVADGDVDVERSQRWRQGCPGPCDHRTRGAATGHRVQRAAMGHRMRTGHGSSRRWRRCALPRGRRAPGHRRRRLRLAAGRGSGSASRELGVEVRTAPPDKDESDMELCLLVALERAVARVDHPGRPRRSSARSTPSPTCCCWPTRASTDCDVAIVGHGSRTWRIGTSDGPGRGARRRAAPATIVSLLPLDARVEGVRTDGLRFPLHEESLAAGPVARPLQRAARRRTPSVTTRRGRLLVVHTDAAGGPSGLPASRPGGLTCALERTPRRRTPPGSRSWRPRSLLLAGSLPATAQPETLTLMTHDSFYLPDAVIEAFEAEHDVRLEVLPSGDAGSMVNQAILTADRPLADVLYGIDNTFLSRALEADIFEPYASPALEAVPADLVGSTPGTASRPSTPADVCLNIDREAFVDGALPLPDDLARPPRPGPGRPAGGREPGHLVARPGLPAGHHRHLRRGPGDRLAGLLGRPARQRRAGRVRLGGGLLRRLLGWLRRG